MNMSKKVYLAGPMKGYPKFNFPLFHEKAKELREKGYFVFSPAERDIERHGGDDSIFTDNVDGDIEVAFDNGFSLRDALRDDTHFICQEADAIALLPNWEYSAGACAEWQLARALRLEFLYL